jgi:hypothetical protein
MVERIKNPILFEENGAEIPSPDHLPTSSQILPSPESLQGNRGRKI